MSPNRLQIDQRVMIPNGHYGWQYGTILWISEDTAAGRMCQVQLDAYRKPFVYRECDLHVSDIPLVETVVRPLSSETQAPQVQQGPQGGPLYNLVMLYVSLYLMGQGCGAVLFLIFWVVVLFCGFIIFMGG